MNRPPDLLTVQEVAAAFRVSTATVRRWAADGQLTPISMPGKLLRFRRDDVAAYLAPEPQDAA